MIESRYRSGTRIVRALKWALVLACGAFVFAAMSVFSPPPAFANGGVIQLSSTGGTSIRIAKGKPRTVRTSVPFYEIVLGDPSVANVSPLTDRSFYVLGNELGTTGIALFDENRQLVGSIDIEVTLDAEGLADTIRENVPGTNIKVTSANGRLMLSGSAQDAVAADRAERIASRFSGEEEIINSVAISSSQQVQLNVRFVEINRQVGRELGAQIGVSYVGSDGGFSFNSAPGSGSAVPAAQIIGSLLTGGYAIDVAIKALEDRGVARRLAEPNLIARSGEKASFLAGGEFPIPVPAGDNTIAIEYRKYGVSLDFTPTVLSDGLVSLEIEPEVSSIDASASYTINGVSVPGFIVRRASTSVDLKSGQSFMIAGLLQTQNDISTQRIPGLGNLPVIGALFSSKAYQRRETDLVIIVTPHLVKPIDPSKKMATPFDGSAPASSVDYFLGNQEEVRPASVAHAFGATGPGSAAPAGLASGHFLDLPEN